MRLSDLLRWTMVVAGVSAATAVTRSTIANDRWLRRHNSVVVLNPVPLTTPSAPAAAASSTTGTAQPKPGFKGPADLEDAVTIATSVSPDKQVTTVLFRNLAASVEPLKGGPLVDERTLTVILPLEVQKSDVLLTFDIRGYAELHNCSGTLLLKPSGPSAKMIEFDKQSQAIGAVDAKSSPSDPGAAAREKAKPVRDTSNEGRDFFDRTITVLKKGATAKVTFVLMVDREFANSSAGGFIEIDSLDVSISDVPLTTNAPAPPAEAPKPASGD